MERTTAELEAGLDHIRQSPTAEGRLELIVRRPAIDEREVLEVGELDLTVGLVGDTWSDRKSSRTHDGAPHPHMQLNVMNARAADLVSGSRDRWPLAGDQLYVDLDLSDATAPPGSRLQIGTAVIEVSAQPHTGCAKFSQRFGREALRFVNSPVGRQLKLRGINARVVVAGTVRVGDAIVVEQPMTEREIDELGARFFAAVEAGDIDTVAECYADDATVWHNYDQVSQAKDDNLKVLAWIGRHLHDRKYTEVRRTVVTGGFVQQHVLRGRTESGEEIVVPAMMRVDCASGRIRRIDEYLDTAQVAALMRR
jgi:MOSC domain-containing protein YiiM